MKLQLDDLIKYCHRNLFIGNGMRGTMLAVYSLSRRAGGWVLVLDRTDLPLVRLQPQEVQINDVGEVSLLEFATKQFVHLRFRVGDDYKTVATAEVLQQIIEDGKQKEQAHGLQSSTASAQPNEQVHDGANSKDLHP